MRSSDSANSCHDDSNLHMGEPKRCGSPTLSKWRFSGRSNFRSFSAKSESGYHEWLSLQPAMLTRPGMDQQHSPATTCT
eukprot:351487-Chlamydomonas_euryale.AAC.15